MDEAQTASAAARPPRRRPLGVIIVTVGLVLTGLSAYLVAVAALLGDTVPWTDVPLLGETSDVIALRPVPGPSSRPPASRSARCRWSSRSASSCSGPGVGPG